MSKKNNYKVYVHINKVNGKRYYGITKQEVENRWRNGKGYSNNDYFWNSINKYGWDNFEHIVIAKGLTEEEAKWLEIELIREWDTTNRDKGYNISLGGESSNHSEESRKKMSESHKGMTFSEEHKKNLSEAHKGQDSPNKTKVYCVELDMYFDTITEASKYVGCTVGNISSVLGKNGTAKGYHWIYAEDVNEENINKVLRVIKVYCVELDMYFDTVKKASEYVGCSQQNISAVLSPNSCNKTAKGYHWVYAEDVEKIGIENNKVS